MPCRAAFQIGAVGRAARRLADASDAGFKIRPCREGPRAEDLISEGQTRHRAKRHFTPAHILERSTPVR